MSMLHAIFVDPFAMIAETPLFFVEVLIGGLMAGVMYSLVALGFVLIFKASGVFNFAQGAMVLFAALFFAGLIDDFGVNPWLAFVIATGVMIVLAFVIERIVLRPLVNQAPIILFMATIGITFFIDGFGQSHLGQRGAHALTSASPRIPGSSATSSSTSSICSRRSRAARWSPCSPCSSSTPRSDGRCAPSPTTIRRR